MTKICRHGEGIHGRRGVFRLCGDGLWFVRIEALMARVPIDHVRDLHRMQEGDRLKDLHTLDKYRLSSDEIRLFGGAGNSKNGCFKVFVKGRSFFCVASDGGGWAHVSISPCSKKRTFCPTWEEMSAIKDMFFTPEECAVEYHPPKSQYVNNYPFCLNLWRPNGGAEIPMPPMAFV